MPAIGLGVESVPISLIRMANDAATNPEYNAGDRSPTVSRFHQIDNSIAGNRLAPVMESAHSTSRNGSVGAAIESAAPQTATMAMKPRTTQTRFCADGGSQDMPCTTSSPSTAASETVVALAVTRAAASAPASRK